jgi:hypothetical protein
MTDATGFARMRQFLNEYQSHNGGRTTLVNLPDPTTMPPVTQDVRIPREQVIRFRNDFLLLVRFAALKCKLPEDELTPFDLLAPFLPCEPDDDELA